MKTIDPKSLIIHVDETIPESYREDRIAIDTEFAGMDGNRLHRPHGKFSGMGCSFDGQEVWIITDEKKIPQFMKQLDEGVHIYQNAKFDIGQIRRYTNYPDRKLIWDTMIMEQILFAGLYSASEFSLADLSRRWLDYYMDKSVREQFETSDGEMTQEQIEYLAVDVVTTWRVYQKQREHADENDLNVWKNIDRPAMYSVLKLGGMKLDTVSWTKLYEFNIAEANRIQDKYGQEELKGKKTVWTGINLASPIQVKNKLLRLGYKLDGTDEKALAPILEECEFARDVLEFRGRSKAAKTYGIKWIEEHVEEDGRVYSDFFINGAATGRFSSSKPNVENIPVRDGSQFRECFVSAEDYVLVDADFSTQEPRVWSYLAEDTDMQQIFKDKRDIYIDFAKLGFGWEITKDDERRQKRMKPTVLGAIFGLTEHGLLRKDQIPLEEGKELLHAFWNVAFPQSREYADQIRKTKDYVQTIYGRKYWLNPYQFGYENNCLNSPVQGCIDGKSKIFTKEKGIQNIENLSGEKVTVWDGNEFSSAMVLPSGYKQKVVLTLHGNQEIVCSPDHKFLTINSYGTETWRTAQQISDLVGSIWIKQSEMIHSSWSCPTSIPNKFDKKVYNGHTESLLGMDWFDLGVWVGRIASDGTVTKGKGLHLLVAEHEKEILGELVRITTQIASPRVSTINREGKLPIYRIDLDHAALATYLYDSGIKYKIPDFVWENSSTLLGYLQGIFDGDGTVNKDGVLLTFGKVHTHLEWAKEIVFALSLFGITARIVLCKDRINVRIVKKDTHLFCQLVRFLNWNKQAKAQTIHSDNGDVNSYIYGRSIRVKSVQITDKFIPMYDVVNSQTGRFMVNGFITHNSAADITKISGYRFQQEVEKAGYSDRVWLINYIHDELLVECHKSLLDWTVKTLERVMVETAEQTHEGVPAKVGVKFGNSWAEAHG